MSLSLATTAPCFFSQCGSEKLRFTKSPASSSAHSVLISAFIRAKSLEVSTSSALISASGGFFASADPGKITNFLAPAP